MGDLTGRLYPPGTRRKCKDGRVYLNQSYVWRGQIGGRAFEIATGATNKKDASSVARDFIAAIEAGGDQPCPGRPYAFAEVARLYLEARGASKNQRRYVGRLCRQLGHMPVAEVGLVEIARAAEALYPGCRNETKNRQAYGPAAAVLHFAAEAGLRDYLRVTKLKERQAETRRPPDGAAAALLAATEGPQHLLLLFLFAQGWRVSETLSLQWQHVDLANRRLTLYVSKSARWKTIPMHEQVFEALANHQERRDRHVFPWRDRHQVYRWLRPLTRRLGLSFTPHMARHEWGARLRQAGATPRDLMDANTWTDDKAPGRYSDAGGAHAKTVIDRLDVAPENWGKSGGKQVKR